MTRPPGVYWISSPVGILGGRPEVAEWTEDERWELLGSHRSLDSSDPVRVLSPRLLPPE